MFFVAVSYLINIDYYLSSLSGIGQLDNKTARDFSTKHINQPFNLVFFVAWWWYFTETRLLKQIFSIRTS
jgi:hypothetical protein